MSEREQFSVGELTLVGTGANENRFYSGSAAPTAGEFRHGDVVFDSTPSASGFIGWVCTASGTPGTWKTWGAISA